MKQLAKAFLVIIVAIACAVSIAESTRAAAPLEITIQGVLPGANAGMWTFRLYDENQTLIKAYAPIQVTPDGDIFTAYLDVLRADFDGSIRWIGIDPGTGEAPDRIKVNTVPYSIRPETIDSAYGGHVLPSGGTDPWAQVERGLVIAQPSADFWGRSEADSASIMLPAHTSDFSMIYSFSHPGDTRTQMVLRVGDDPNDDITLMPSGNVGIKIDSPTVALDVAGDIHATGTITASNSVSIDGTTDEITAASGTISFDDENLVTNGNIGVGMDNPAAELHIYRDTPAATSAAFENPNPGAFASTGLAFYNDSGGVASIFCSSSGSAWPSSMLFNLNSAAADFLWRNNISGTILAKLTNAGDLGIGTLTPSERLHVNGNICYTGTIGACSDVRFKRNVASLGGALEKVTQLRGVEFDWRRDEFPDRQFSDRRQVGFIAQEVNEFLPSVVSEGNDGYYTVDYGRITPLLVEAVKELDDRNSSQAEQIQSLTAKLVEVEALLQAVLASQDSPGTGTKMASVEAR